MKLRRLNYALGVLLDQALRGLDLLAPEVAQRFKQRFGRPDMQVSLQILKKAGFLPKSAIDVGAYRGEWTALCKHVFPACAVLMVEASAERSLALSRLSRRYHDVQVAQAVLGATAGESRQFLEQESNSGIVTGDRPGACPVTIRTLDDLLRETTPRLEPELLKLDVQGFEFEVLEGGLESLKSVRALVIELSLIPLCDLSWSIRDSIDWLDRQGFRLLDIATFIRRPVDDALWQIDAVFVRKDSGLGGPELGW